MAQPAPAFRFLDPGPLVDRELTLHLAKTVPRDPARQFVSTYHFEMHVGGQIAGDRTETHQEYASGHCEIVLLRAVIAISAPKTPSKHTKAH